ncbi:SIS domain-containing protein [Streptosporangiaceae bacterium NEAU-GS5]|nr:SIS domain-containing protein [Streptosporangiaceae bacterium NEAU-GS5]
MSHTETEIASQPETWRTAATLAEAEEFARQLPRPGERLAVVGCGTSWFIAQAYAVLRERAGHGETDAFAASELPLDRPYDRILALTRSGTTTEVLDLLRATRIPSVAITATPGTPVVKLAGRAISLDFADETSVVQTRYATTQLALLRAHLGEDLSQAIADAEEALAEPLPAELLDAAQFTFLGRGWTCGIAAEAALKMREACRAWTESYPAMEYRHGPISIAGPGRVTWMLGGEVPDGLPGEVERTGGHWRATTKDALAELITVQRLAVARAQAAGLDPDQPLHLTRSVILTE